MTALRPIVADHHFVLATRDTGYRNLAAAIAELVDNAVQASAKNIRILVHESRAPRAGGILGDRQLIIGVQDDGQGMDREGLWTAVQFGGTERFNDRSGAGRFGMGLPNSSVSVTRRLEVYSWRRPGKVLHTHLDIDEIAARVARGIPCPREGVLPTWARLAAGESGTLVVWSRCDRLYFKKATTVADKLREPLGRMYRRLIWKGLRITVNDQTVSTIDPLFCHPGNGAGGGTPYGSTLSYELTSPNGGVSAIAVRFTELPVAKWKDRSNDDKRSAGIVGGAGTSFVRAGREIDAGWKLFGAKRRENYDDWWRCEVLFEPDVDEYFGVTHSKQGVSPTPYLRSILEPDLEATARILNARVRSTFDAAKRSAPSVAVARATRQDRLLPMTIHPAKRLCRYGGFSYAIALEPISGPDFFEVAESRGNVRLTINTDHPFYDRLYRPPATDAAIDQRYALECLLLAAARAYVETGTRRTWTRKFSHSWSNALAAFLETKGSCT